MNKEQIATTSQVVFSPASSQNGDYNGSSSGRFDSHSSASPSPNAQHSSSATSTLPSFYSSTLSLFHSTLLSRLSASFAQLHKDYERKEYDFHTQISLLRQDVMFLENQAKERKESEESLAARLHTVTQETEKEAKKLRAEVHEKELLLVERGNVIRELKRRYKREQELLAESKTHFSQLKVELNQARQQHSHELESLRDQCTKELHASLSQTESISQKRLEAENKLRKRAEEESERYVRQCQQLEAENFLLKQEKVQLTALLQRQLSDLRTASSAPSEFAGHQRALSASIQAQTESENRLARMMVVTSPTPQHAAAAARILSHSHSRSPSASYGGRMMSEY